jgi:nucleoside-diphosphate-sugar epimerase
MAKVLITGANGLLATNIIVLLLEKNYQVKGLLRSKNKYIGPLHSNLELIEGNITSKEDVFKALVDCDFVIHVAALTAHNLSTYDPYYKVNVEATKMLIQASIENNITKFVYVSSANAFGFGSIEDPGNEQRPVKPPFSKSYYALSKLEGQEFILKFKDRIDVSVVNPTFMIGPYDSKPSSGRIILMGYKKKMVFCPPGGKNFINVKDAAKGTVKAMEKGKNGEAYLLAGTNLTYKQFFKKLSEYTGDTPYIISVPVPILLAAGVLGNIMRFLRIKTSLSLTNMKMLCVNNFYTNNKVRKDLGLDFTPIDSGIKEAVEWFKTNGTIS